MEIDKIKNIKEFVQVLQSHHLDLITDIVLEDTEITLSKLRTSNKTIEYRRKIAFIARALYNVSGIAISDYLMVSTVQVSEYIHSAFAQCKENQDYLQEIREIIKKLVEQHQAVFNKI